MHNYLCVGMARWSGSLCVAVALLGSAAPTQAGEWFSLRPVRGTLVLMPQIFGDVHTSSRCWSFEKGMAEYEDQEPGGYFDGRVAVRSRGGCLQVRGWRRKCTNGQIASFILDQGPGETSTEYTIRTPVGEPDVTVTLVEPDLTLLLLRHPEISPLLDCLLAVLGDDCWYEFDAAVKAQALPDDWHEPAGTADAVCALLPLLDSGDWHQRARAEAKLADLGRDAALYLLLRLDHAGLSAQANLAIDQLTRRYPLLSLEDREVCRNDPSRLDRAYPEQIGRAQ